MAMIPAERINESQINDTLYFVETENFIIMERRS